MSRAVFLSLVLCLVMIAGCSQSRSPVTTESTPDSGLPVISPPAENSNHNLLGIWTVDFYPESDIYSISNDRFSSQHFNVTSLIPAPGILIRSYNPATHILDVDVTITNPYPIDVYDVRLIIYTDSIGHLLLNYDNHTSLYDIPGGEIINPFKAYAKDAANRKFAGQTQNTENVQLYLPSGNMQVRFAIDASFPGNCEEPYAISGFVMDKLFSDTGSKANVAVDVKDWQDNVSFIKLYCPSICGSTLVSLLQQQDFLPERWEGTILNSNIAPVGSYPGYIIAGSDNSGNIWLYSPVMLDVSIYKEGWIKTWGSGRGDGQTEENGLGMACDNQGNFYVTGTFISYADFDPSVWINIILSNSNSGDAYLCKFDHMGNLLWVRTWGGIGVDRGYKVAVDESNNIYVGGYFEDTVDFDPGASVNLRTSLGEADFYLSKFDSDGNFLWVDTWSAECFNHHNITWYPEFAFDLDIMEGTQDIYVSGCFSNTVDLDPGPGLAEFTSNGQLDAYINKLDKDGKLLWVRTWGGTDNESADGVIADITSGVFITGQFKGLVDFDPVNDRLDEHYQSHTSSYLSKFDSDGNYYWVKIWGSAGGSVKSKDLTQDLADSIYVTGTFTATTDFDPGSGEDIHIHPLFNAADVFLSKFDSEGNFNWARTFGGNNSLEIVESVLTDDSDNVFICGEASTTGGPISIDFDPGPGEDWLICNNTIATNMFISKFNSSGEYKWARLWCSDSSYSYSLTKDNANNIYFTGEYHHLLDFNPGQGEDIRDSSEGSIYLMKLLQNGYWE
jgi:hypothetical protein